MADKKYFGQKRVDAITVSVTVDGYLELCQPNEDEEVKFHLSPGQSVRLAKYINANLKEQRSNWGDGESGDK